VHHSFLFAGHKKGSYSFHKQRHKANAGTDTIADFHPDGTGGSREIGDFRYAYPL
jgi:hypothetical protein